MASNILYYAGFAAIAFYLSGDILGGLITPRYNFIRNAVSELVQSGAENRRFLSLFFFLHAIMTVLFAIGILAQHPFALTRLVFTGGVLLLVVGISHAFSSSVFPMDPIGAESTFPGVMHLVLVAISVVSTIILMPLIGIGFSRLHGWEYFATFTFVSLAIIVISGAVSPIVIGKNIKVMGLNERITAYTFYIWLGVLAYLLIS